MKIASQTNLRKDVSFHLTKLPYLPSKATINSTIKIDKAITKRFKTEPKKIINEP